MKVAINGLGRIGRSFLKIALEKGINIVAINDLTDTETLAYLIKHDSIYKEYNKKIQVGKKEIKIGNRKIKVFSEPNPSKLPWKKLGIDVVVESTGFFRDRKGAGKHLKSGAKKVLISAPAKNPDATIVLGVNQKFLRPEYKIISMASCTTNCLAPVAKVLNDCFKIKRAFMTTVHAYTTTQALLDLPNKKLRRGRAAAQNIVPTTSGATTSVAEVIPELKGKMDGLALRVPVACGSIVDFVAEIEKPTTREEINKEFKKASNNQLRGILQYCEDEIVSSDVIGNPYSSIFDSQLTQVLGNSGNLIKVLSWYDNEYGYSCRIADLLRVLQKLK